jgi:hypothetical protein
LLGFAALLGACASPAPAPVGSPLEPLGSMGNRVPDDPDLIGRDLALAALGGTRRESAPLLAELAAFDAERLAAGQRPTGLVPSAQDLVNATLDDGVAYRRASRELLDRDDVRLDVAFKHRLEASVKDDPLALANRRLRDELVKDTAEIVNALVAPVMKAAMSPDLFGIRGGYALLRSVVNLVVAEMAEDDLELRERQALAHWKKFLDENPAAPEAAEIVRRTEETQVRWNRTRRDRAMRVAKKAADRQQWAAALIFASQAERYSPEDGDAEKLRERAARELEHERAERARSLTADPTTAFLDADPEAHALALALLSPTGQLEETAQEILADDPQGAFADEAAYTLALAESESGDDPDEDDHWKMFENVADDDVAKDNMARHAEALIDDPRLNPYSAFRDARGADRRSRLSWIFFGPLYKGPQDRNLPGGLEWLLDAPSYLQMMTTFPSRLVQYRIMKQWPFGSRTARHARQYLEANPDGEHVHEVADWLGGWEKRRGNHLAAWQYAEAAGEDDDKLADLRERASEQALEGARRQKRPDVRLRMLRQIVQTFQDTEAGSEAGLLARDELQRASYQRIRISRQFLRENPEVAGPDGIGLVPGLLDGEKSNGELHPDGVVLTGGRVMEFNFVGESGRERGEPMRKRKRISDERLARLVAMLDETTIENQAEDPDDFVESDPDRDLFFDRARLGVADTPDRRTGARSDYTFLGMRERYGLVRSRESILPFELVLQASLPDLSFGAFPRIRTPKETPDAMLFR